MRLAGLVALAYAACLPLLAWVTHSHPAFLACSGALGLLTVARHRANIARLLRHEEPKVGQRR